MAMIAFVALGVLSWMTLSDARIRFAALAVLAFFAIKTWVRRSDVMDAEKKPDIEP
jgi:membrane protein implicated in regulation of membrane protease activity